VVVRVFNTLSAAFIVVCCLVVAGLLAMSQNETSPAPALHPGSSLRQPYGGCKEAAGYPGTAGFAWCARHHLLHLPNLRCYRTYVTYDRCVRSGKIEAVHE